MKPSLLILAFFFQIIATAQSPYLSVFVKMDSLKSSGIRYKIEMKICKPQKASERGDWFSHEESTIKFDSLKATGIDCGNYFDNKENSGNHFEYSNQLFAWESILVFKISNASSRAWHPEMYVVMPIKYKSFVTHIKFSDLEFQSGKVLYLDEFDHKQNENDLTIDQSLKDHRVVDVKDFFLKGLFESD